MPVNSKFNSLFRNCTVWLLVGGCLWWAGHFSLFGQTPAAIAPDSDEETKWLQSVHTVWNDLISATMGHVTQRWEKNNPVPKTIITVTPTMQYLERRLDELARTGAEKGFRARLQDGKLAPEPAQKPNPTLNQSELPTHFQQAKGKLSKLAQLEALLRKNAVIRVTPEYPALSPTFRLSGDVLVEVTIGPDGKVITTRRLKGHPVLYQASERAAKQWRFRPLKEFSEPVDASKPLVGVLTFRFTL